MAVLRAAQRNKLDSSMFAVPGKRKLPMHDRTHAALAWTMVDRTHDLTPGERSSARTRIKKRLQELGVDTSNYADEKHSDSGSSRINFTPPEAVRSQLRKGLKLYKEGRGGDGLVAATISWARRLAAGERITAEKARKMNAWHARHKVDKRPGWSTPGKETPGYVAFLLWGGDSGRAWSARLVKAMEREEKYSSFSPVGPVTSLGGTVQMGMQDFTEEYALDPETGFYGKGSVTGTDGTSTLTSKADGSAVAAAAAYGKRTGALNEIFQNYDLEDAAIDLDEVIDSVSEGLSAGLSFLSDLNLVDAYDLSCCIESELVKKIFSSFADLKGPEEVNCYFSNAIDEDLLLHLSEFGSKLKIPVARMGTFVHPTYGIVTFNQKDFDEIQKNFENDEAGFKPYLRYGHSRFPEAVDGEAAVAYLEALEQDDDVLWGIYDPLDDNLVEEIRKGAYVNASAELRRYAMSKRDGSPIGTLLTAHALTNAPFVPGMPNNQVLSNTGYSNDTVKTRHISLNLSEGEQPMSQGNANLEALSTLMSELETLSISVEQRQAIRSKLASMMSGGAQAGAEPQIVSDKEAGKPGAAYKTEDGAIDPENAEHSEAKSGEPESQALNKPAGKPGMAFMTKDGDVEKNSSHGEPLREAGKALMDMGTSEDEEEKREEDEEKMSSVFGELLSSMAKMMPFMKKGSKASKAAMDEEKNSAGMMSKKQAMAEEKNSASMMPKKDVEEDSYGKSYLMSHTMTAKENEVMNEAQVKQLIELAVAGVEQKFSTQLAEKDNMIKSLEAELSETKNAAQQFSNHLADSAFENRVNNLVAAGVPAVVVQKVAEVARMVRGTEQKLSDGTSIDAAELLFRALDVMPGESRIQYGQVGQNLSNTDAEDEYAEIVSRIHNSQNK